MGVGGGGGVVTFARSGQEDASQYAQRLREALRQLRLACGCAAPRQHWQCKCKSSGFRNRELQDAPIVGELGMEFLVGDSFAFVESCLHKERTELEMMSPLARQLRKP